MVICRGVVSFSFILRGGVYFTLTVQINPSSTARCFIFNFKPLPNTLRQHRSAPEMNIRCYSTQHLFIYMLQMTKVRFNVTSAPRIVAHSMKRSFSPHTAFLVLHRRRSVVLFTQYISRATKCNSKVEK